MGLLSTLALLALPLLPRQKPDDVRITELEAKVDALNRELYEARRDCSHWESTANHWRARYEQAINPVLERERDAQIRLQVMLNQAMAQHAQAQVNAQQYMQNNLGLAYQGLLGQQNAYDFCNCVPARHDLFLQGGDA